MSKIEVGILGATGTVGQRFVQLLEGHPWFELAWVAASDRSAGKRYGDAAAWQLETPPPPRVADLTVGECTPGQGPQLVFSSMAGAQAGEIEAAFAQAGHIVVSNSSHFRMAPDVPLLVPEINPAHLGLIAVQRRERGWSGAIVTNPNCAAVVLVVPLAALREFGPRRLTVTSFQAVSGAGYPGVASLDILGNVVPFIGGDEEKKVEAETPEDPRHPGGRRHPPPAAHCQRLLQPGADGRRPPDRGERRVRAPPRARRADRRPRGLPRPAPGAPAAECAAPAHPRLHRERPAAAAQGRRPRARHGDLGRPGARVPGLPLPFRGAVAQRAARAPPAPPC